MADNELKWMILVGVCGLVVGRYVLPAIFRRSGSSESARSSESALDKWMHLAEDDALRSLRTQNPGLVAMIEHMAAEGLDYKGIVAVVNRSQYAHYMGDGTEAAIRGAVRQARSGESR